MLPDASRAGTFVPELFEGKDISALGEQTDSSAQPGSINFETAAGDLGRAVVDYILLATRAHERAAPNEKRAWLDRVEAEAVALLETLGMTADDWAAGATVHQSIKLVPAIKELRAGAVYAPGPFPCGVPTDIRRIFGDERFSAAMERENQRAIDQGETLDVAKAFLACGLEATDALLPLVPRALGLLVALARCAPRPGPQRGGRRPDELRDVLVRRLTEIYRDIYGELPATREKGAGRIPNSPAVRWMRDLLRLATDRLAHADDPRLVAGAHRLGYLAELSDARLTDLIEKGKAAAGGRFRKN
jgi:hypothetical protein